MITHNDQINLFGLIAKKISKDIECYAFGGTAMMFYGYKDETKDIDLYFDDPKSRQEFITAIYELGFKEHSPMKIYIQEKLREKNRPLIYMRNDNRFDLFVKKIFKTVLSNNMKENLFAVHEFKGKKILTVKVPGKEHIVQLKSITERQNDFDDIVTIVSKEKDFDWDYLIKEVLWQHQNGDSWALLDLEKTIKALKDYVFIEEKFLKMLYKK